MKATAEKFKHRTFSVVAVSLTAREPIDGEIVAQLLEGQHPRDVTSVMRKSLRKGKVFVDWSQNDQHKTTVCVYSLRARERPTVSTPVTWDEVAACLSERKPDKLRFESQEVLRRVDKLGDLFAPVLKLKQKLPSI